MEFYQKSICVPNCKNSYEDESLKLTKKRNFIKAKKNCKFQSSLVKGRDEILGIWESRNPETSHLFLELGQVTQVRLGQVGVGQVRLGQVGVGQVRLGQVRLGLERCEISGFPNSQIPRISSLPVRLGQVRLGKVR